MSGWEIFTWFNAGVLVIGSVIVFAFFVAQLPGLLWPPDRRARESDREVEPPDAGR